MRALVLCLILVPAPAWASARPVTAELAAECRIAIRAFDTNARLSEDDTVQAAGCLAYITGVADVLKLPVYQDMAPTLCAPDNANALQFARVFVRWADTHPELVHIDRLAGTIRALTEAFPCQ